LPGFLALVSVWYPLEQFVDFWYSTYMAKVRTWYRQERKKWYASYRVPGLHDKRVCKSFKTKSDMFRYKEYMEHKLNHEEWQGVKGLTWGAATEAYLLEREHYIGDKTKSDIQNTFSRFKEIVGSIKTNLLSQHHVVAFIAGRCKSGRYKAQSSKNTVNKDLRNLRAFYNWCVENSFAAPGVKFKMLPVTEKAFVPPTRDQLLEMFATAENQYYPLYVRMVLAMTTGLRRGAVERLYLNNRHDDYIDIERKMLVTTETKTKEQVIKPLGDYAMSVVTRQISMLPDGSDKLLVDRWDGKCRKAFDSIKIKGIDFHAMRNIAVSLLGDMGESAAVLQKKLGHKSFSTTQKYYLGVDQDTDKRTTKLLDDFLASTRQ